MDSLACVGADEASQQNFDWSELELFVTVPEETPVIDFDSLSRIMKLVLSCGGRRYVTNPKCFFHFWV